MKITPKFLKIIIPILSIFILLLAYLYGNMKIFVALVFIVLFAGTLAIGVSKELSKGQDSN